MPREQSHTGGQLVQIGARLRHETAELLKTWADVNGFAPATAVRVLVEHALEADAKTWDQIAYREGFERGRNDGYAQVAQKKAAMHEDGVCPTCYRPKA